MAQSGPPHLKVQIFRDFQSPHVKKTWFLGAQKAKLFFSLIAFQKVQVLRDFLIKTMTQPAAFFTRACGRPGPSENIVRKAALQHISNSLLSRTNSLFFRKNSLFC